MKRENQQNMDESQNSIKKWRFFRAGGFDQVRIETGAELIALDTLDQKLWVSLGCPIQGLEFDARTLELLDLDGDQHIRAPELLAALAWTKNRLADVEALARDEPLALASINLETPEGQKIYASAKTILTHLGKKEAMHISVEEASQRHLLFPPHEPNGDGIIPPELASDLIVRETIQTILTVFGGEKDRSEAMGITQEQADRFFTEVAQYLNWYDAQRPLLFPLGEQTAEAWAVLQPVKEKIDDYFMRCQLGLFDAISTPYLNSIAEDWQTIRTEILTPETVQLKQLPLARIIPNQPLPLKFGLNPAWASAIKQVQKVVFNSLFGHEYDSLSETQWHALLTKFEGYATWAQENAQNPLSVIPLNTLRLMNNPHIQTQINQLIHMDLAVAEEANSIEDVEKLARYCRDLMRLANNFVSFTDFYQRRRKALFQAGTLYLDGRSCELCLYVTDLARHNQLASLSKLYLVYCDCVRGTEKITIVASFTAGDSEQLMLGRNGIFYDHQGQDWHATVIKIIDNPIGLRQAFWSPYKKVGGMITEQLQKFAAAKAKGVEENTSKAIIQSTATKLNTTRPPAPSAPTPFDISKFAGIFAALGLAMGALGTAVASIITGLLSLKFWQIPLALFGVLLTISGPSLVMAWFKLKGRTLAPLLDANGWAINARAKINIPFGTTLTQVATLPPNAERALFDPFAEKRPRWYWIMGLVIFLLISSGLIGWFIFRTRSVL